MQVGGVLQPPRPGGLLLPPLNLPSPDEVGEWLDDIFNKPRDPAAVEDRKNRAALEKRRKRVPVVATGGIPPRRDDDDKKEKKEPKKVEPK